MADYTANAGGHGGSDPTIDKEVLISRIHEQVAETSAFLSNYGFSLKALVDAPKGTFEQLGLIQNATNALCESLEIKKEYQTYSSELARLMKYVDRQVSLPKSRHTRMPFWQSMLRCRKSASTPTTLISW